MQATITALLDHPLALRMVVLTIENLAVVGMFLVVANYPSEQLNTKLASLDPNDVVKLCRISTIMTAGALFRVNLQNLATDHDLACFLSDIITSNVWPVNNPGLAALPDELQALFKDL